MQHLLKQHHLWGGNEDSKIEETKHEAAWEFKKKIKRILYLEEGNTTTYVFNRYKSK